MIYPEVHFRPDPDPSLPEMKPLYHPSQYPPLKVDWEALLDTNVYSG